MARWSDNGSGWADKAAWRMRQIHRLREDLDDHYSPVDDVYRPVGMPRKIYRSKKARLAKYEAELRHLLEINWGKYIERKKNAIRSKSGKT